MKIDGKRRKTEIKMKQLKHEIKTEMKKMEGEVMSEMMKGFKELTSVLNEKWKELSYFSFWEGVIRPKTHILYQNHLIEA